MWRGTKEAHDVLQNLLANFSAVACIQCAAIVNRNNISVYSIVLFPLTIVIYGERPRLSPNIVNVNFFLVDFSAKHPLNIYVLLYIVLLFVCTCILHILWHIFLLDTFYMGDPIGIVVEFVSFAFFFFFSFLIRSVLLFLLYENCQEVNGIIRI